MSALGGVETVLRLSANAGVMRLPVKTSSPLIFLQAGARSSFGSLFELRPGVHAFSGEPCGWCRPRGMLPSVRTGARRGVLSTNPAYSVFVVLRVLALRPSRNLPLLRWQRWMLA